LPSHRSSCTHGGPRSPRSDLRLATEGFDTLDLKGVKALLDESADLTMNFETASKLKAVAFPSTMGSMAAVLEGRMELT
jgi:hypothetical protein